MKTHKIEAIKRLCKIRHIIKNNRYYNPCHGCIFDNLISDDGVIINSHSCIISSYNKGIRQYYLPYDKKWNSAEYIKYIIEGRKACKTHKEAVDNYYKRLEVKNVF